MTKFSSGLWRVHVWDTTIFFANISLFSMLSELVLTCAGGRGTPMKPRAGDPIEQNQNIAAKCKWQEQLPYLHACTERSVSLCHHVRLTSRVRYIMRFDSLDVWSSSYGIPCYLWHFGNVWCHDVNATIRGATLGRMVYNLVIVAEMTCCLLCRLYSYCISSQSDLLLWFP